MPKVDEENPEYLADLSSSSSDDSSDDESSDDSKDSDSEEKFKTPPTKKARVSSPPRAAAAVNEGVAKSSGSADSSPHSAPNSKTHAAEYRAFIRQVKNKKSFQSSWHQTSARTPGSSSGSGWMLVRTFGRCSSR